jgi:hypothetical protein
MDKSIIIQALNKAFLSEANGGPAIALANKMKKENSTINKTGVKAVATDMTKIEKDQKKDDSNQKSMAQNKFNAVDKEKTYHDEMEIMNGQEMIQYDRTPNEEFTDRAIEAIEGSARMGNNPEWANVVAKGQGGDPEFGKNLVKHIKASQKKRVAATPTTKMYGDDWEITKDTSHKDIAVESRKIGKNLIKEGILADKHYTHFAVNKNTGKLLEAWNYKGIDREELMQFKKDYFFNDLKDLDLPLKTNEIKIVTKGTLVREGINPEDINAWDDLKKPKTENIHNTAQMGGILNSRGTAGYNPDATNQQRNKQQSTDKKPSTTKPNDADVAGDNYEDSDRAASAGNIRYENTFGDNLKNNLKIGDNVTFKMKGQDVGGTIADIVGLNARISSKSLNQDTSLPLNSLTKAMNENNKKPQIKESMKRITFKKEFNGVGNALKLIPESYKVDMKVFEMTDKNETYKVRWEGSLTEGKAVVLTAANKSNINEDIQKMKHLFNYKSEDTLGTVKGKARLDENAAFADVWSKSKALMTEEGDIESATAKTGVWDKIKPAGAGAAQPKLQTKDGTAPAPKNGEWDEISVPAMAAAKIKSQAKGAAPTTAKTSGDLDDAVDFATKENEPEAKKKLQEKDGTAPAPKTGDLDDAVDYATSEIEPEAKKKLQTKDGVAPAPKNGKWEDVAIPQAADAKKHVTMNEDIETDDDAEDIDVKDDAYDASSSDLDVPDVDDMQPTAKDIKSTPAAPSKFVGNNDTEDDDDDEDNVEVPAFNNPEAKLLKSPSTGALAIMVKGGRPVVVPAKMTGEAQAMAKNSKGLLGLLAKIESSKEMAGDYGNGLNELSPGVRNNAANAAYISLHKSQSTSGDNSLESRYNKARADNMDKLAGKLNTRDADRTIPKKYDKFRDATQPKL